jgi:hypothetical protein
LVAGPLQDVAVHIVEAEGAGGIDPDRRRAGIAIVVSSITSYARKTTCVSTPSISLRIPLEVMTSSIFP